MATVVEQHPLRFAHRRVSQFFSVVSGEHRFTTATALRGCERLSELLL